MLELGTPFTPRGKKALLLGSGELGKEVTIELQRYGVEVVALDKYAGAPAMHVANRSITVSMLDGDALRAIVEEEKPDYIIPEIEAIATPTLIALEKEGWNVVPTARATFITMNRREIRNLAAVELGLPTSPFEFADTEEEYLAAVSRIGLPCVVKPVMSSSGHGQSLVRNESQVAEAWREAQEGGRAGGGAVIVEGFVDFDYEITLLTVRHIGGTSFCEPIGHYQENGDYRRSWQPQPMSETAIIKAREIAKKVTDALGGYGIFGVEFFIKGDDVIFSELSPRPHDTGMVTLISQHLSEFALHVRALLGLPIPEITFYGPSASRALLAEGDSRDIAFTGMEKALSIPGTDMRVFGKPEVKGHRRMGVMLATAPTVEEACEKVERAAAEISIDCR
ncbi:MAG: formate-dependent phosphoribosylglycinamide formyltransferase [Muribaculaceae bacterium]|nr:formate-dependent phosphoribosylglycinamide formyltransferase [Muribaculaceae bacterium]